MNQPVETPAAARCLGSVSGSHPVQHRLQNTLPLWLRYSTHHKQSARAVHNHVHTESNIAHLKMRSRLTACLLVTFKGRRSDGTGRILSHSIRCSILLVHVEASKNCK
jgi:hypothetical protein